MSSLDPDFICQDCGVAVYRFPVGLPVPEPACCAVCAWMREFVPDPKEQESIRGVLKI